MIHRFILLLILGIDALILFFQTSQISISSHEASLLYGDFSFLQLLINSSLSSLGSSDFALRLPMISMHLLSVMFLYLISAEYIKQRRNRVWMILIFTLLPGVISSALLIDSAGLVIFGLMLFLYIHIKHSEKLALALLLPYSFMDAGFVYLFASVAIFSIYKKKKDFMLVSLLALISSIYMYGIDVGGIPVGHFLDSIGIYSAIFTPIIFIYLVYVLYRKFLTKEIELLWFLSALPLLLSLIFSFRQRIEIEHFAPYLIVALPLAAQTFESSYRVRLKEFRGKYKTIFLLSFVFLIFNALIVFFNKELYSLLEKPQKHFAYKMHIAKELSAKLKEKNIYCVEVDKKMSERLKFYGIEECNKYLLKESSNKNNKGQSVTVSYSGEIVYSAYVTNINNK